MEIIEDRSDMHESLPDLACLESCEMRDTAFLPMLIMYGGFAVWQTAMVVRLWWQYRQFVARETVTAVGVMVALLIWIVLRVLMGYTRYWTDATGLTMRGPLRRRTITWPDIIQASTGKRRGSACLMLDTTGGTVRISTKGFGTAGACDCVVASVWQHLRRLGRADGMILPDTVKSLWSAIPDEVPAEADYGHAPTARDKFGRIVALLAGPALFGGLLLCISRRAVPLFLPLLLVVAAIEKWAVLPNLRRMPNRVTLRPDGIEAEGFGGTTYVPWSSLSYAGWHAWGLLVKSENPRAEIVLPYSLGGKDSEHFILCAIRYVRAASSQLAVPLPVLISANPDYLKQTTIDSRRVATLQRAYLATLDEPVRRKIARLQGLVPLSTCLGMVVGCVVGLGNVTGHIAERILSGPGTRYFVPSTAGPIAFPLMFGGMAFAGVAAERLGYRLAGPYREAWHGFCQIGSGNKRLNRIIMWSLSVTGVTGILASPVQMCCYTRVTDRGIAMNRLMRFHEKFYSWNEITKLERVHSTRIDHGKTKSNCKYIVRFSDGTDWTISDDGTFWEKEKLTKAMSFVERTGKRPSVDRWD